MIVENDCLILQTLQMEDSATIREALMAVLMSVMASPQAEREAQRAQANREELVERIARAIRVDGTVEPLQGLHFYRHSAALETLDSIVEPSLCVVAQGSKESLLGESHSQYDPFHYLLVTVDLPYVGQVLEASKERPYLSLRLEFDLTLIRSIMLEADHAIPSHPTDMRAIAVSPLDVALLDAVVRLVRLLDSPAEAQVLQPLITQELIYRLLIGEQGDRLRRLAAPGGHTSHIAYAVERLRRDFDQPQRIEQLAAARVPQQRAARDHDERQVPDGHIQLPKHPLGLRRSLQLQPPRRQPVARQHLQQPPGAGIKPGSDQRQT
jgi:hypothetical protein